MPRVIQDSDDEDAVSDDAQPAAVEEEATTSATATSDEASQPIKAVASAITKSTSSSGAS